MSFVVKKVGRKFASQRLAGYEPADPHYEEYQDTQGKTKKRKRPMPEGLSKRDKRILVSVRRRAHYLDKGFTICGFRFGWTFLLGLIPFAGDIASFLLGYLLVRRKCLQAELPATLQQRMLFNQLVSLGVGFVPLVGDIGTAVWKANSRNAALLEEFLVARAAKTSTEDESAQRALGAKIDMASGEPIQPVARPVASGSASTGTATPPVKAIDTKSVSKQYGWNRQSDEL